MLDSSNSNYVTSPASRTIWVAIDSQADFEDRFGTPLFYSDDVGIAYWKGNLSLPIQVEVTGLWVDTWTVPPGSDMTPGVSVTLPQGDQSIGNGLEEPTDLAPQTIGALYDFPLAGLDVKTPPVGLIEHGIGTALSPGSPSFQTRVTQYLESIDESGDGRVYVQGESGQAWTEAVGGERSLDVGVSVAVNPDSDLVLFNGSGYNGNAQATVFTAIQSAVFETGHPVAAWSSSFNDVQSMAPGSPFHEAYWQLYVDVALANQTAFNAVGDGGSGNQTGNGLTNLHYNVTQPYGILVGGTSLSTKKAATADHTLSTIVDAALAGDRAVIWPLVSGGLTILPASVQDSQFFVETVWNWYRVVEDHGVPNIKGNEMVPRSDGLPDQHGDVGRRRPDTADPRLPDRLRPRSGDRRPPSSARPWRTRRGGQWRRQHELLRTR